jgi:Beta-lactamase
MVGHGTESLPSASPEGPSRQTVAAKAEGAADWNAALQKEILDPLGMKDTTYSAAAITAAANRAQGYRYTADRSVAVPFQQLAPYNVDGAGDINSNIEDMVKWVSLQLAGGTTPAGQRIVSAENLAYTHTPKVAINDKTSYALGWIIQQTPNGNIVWHNGGTSGFGSMVILQLDRKLGVIALTNQTNVGMPDAIGLWTMDRLLRNPMIDHGATSLAQAKKTFDDGVKQFARPGNPQPSPPLGPLAGNFANPGFGKTILRTEGDEATLELSDTGAKLRLDPWNGAVYTAGWEICGDDRRSGSAANGLRTIPDRQGRQACRPSPHVLGWAGIRFQARVDAWETRSLRWTGARAARRLQRDHGLTLTQAPFGAKPACQPFSTGVLTLFAMNAEPQGGTPSTNFRPMLSPVASRW